MVDSFILGERIPAGYAASHWSVVSIFRTDWNYFIILDSGGEIFYVSLVATDNSSTTSDVISIRPEVFTLPLHSVLVTIGTNLSEILAGGIFVSLSLSQRIASVTNSSVRLLSLSEGSTVIRVSFVGYEVSRDCSEVQALLAKIQLSNGSYTKEFIASFGELFLISHNLLLYSSVQLLSTNWKVPLSDKGCVSPEELSLLRQLSPLSLSPSHISLHSSAPLWLLSCSPCFSHQSVVCWLSVVTDTNDTLE